MRLILVDNDSGEARAQPRLHTGYVRWSAANSGGYTLLATYHHATQDLPAGPWRLLLLSDAKLVSPLGKQEVQSVTRFAGAYVANKYHRLLRDVLLTTGPYPLALRLCVSREDVYLRVKVGRLDRGHCSLGPRVDIRGM